MASSLNHGGGTSSSTKKHGFSLSRFSLRRFLNSTALGRTVGTGSKSRNPSQKDFQIEVGLYT